MSHLFLLLEILGPKMIFLVPETHGAGYSLPFVGGAGLPFVGLQLGGAGSPFVGGAALPPTWRGWFTERRTLNGRSW